MNVMNFTFILPRIEFAQSEQIYGKVMASSNVKQIHVFHYCYIHFLSNVYGANGQKNPFMKKEFLPIYAMKCIANKHETGMPWSEFQFLLPIFENTPITLFKAPVDLTFANNALNVVNCLIAYDPDSHHREIIPIEIIPFIKTPKPAARTSIMDSNNEIEIYFENTCCTPFGTITCDILVKKVQEKSGLRLAPAIKIQDISPSNRGFTHIILGDEFKLEKINKGDRFNILIQCQNYTRFCSSSVPNFVSFMGGIHIQLFTGLLKRTVKSDFIPIEIGVRTQEELIDYLRMPKIVDLTNQKGKIQFDTTLIPEPARVLPLDPSEIAEFTKKIFRNDPPPLYEIKNHLQYVNVIKK